MQYAASDQGLHCLNKVNGYFPSELVTVIQRLRKVCSDLHDVWTTFGRHRTDVTCSLDHFE